MICSDEMIGDGVLMTALRRSIRKAAQCSWTVLIQGESGTGKGMVARAIHSLSSRSGHPFVVLNCGAIAENLIESELFGHERGSFTGADRLRKGKFEAADRGAIFLDEIGDLSLAGQTRLLHVLQDREIERLGGEGRRLRIDVRVIAATNRDLRQMVAEGTFRQDLFFRLNVFSMRTPVLRDRREDIPILADRFATRAAMQSGRTIAGIAPQVLNLFLKYSWPGNVRELENVVQRAVAVGDAEEIRLEDLPEDFAADSIPALTNKRSKFYEAIESTERELCIHAISASNGNCLQAAKRMGLHRNSLYRLIRKHRLSHLLQASM